MSEKYKELLEQYDVKVLSTFRSRGTFQCETEQGLALLKEYHGSLQKLALEYEWKEKLANAGFLTTDRYFLTKEESLVTYDRYRTPFVLKHYFKVENVTAGTCLMWLLPAEILLFYIRYLLLLRKFLLKI